MQILNCTNNLLKIGTCLYLSDSIFKFDYFFYLIISENSYPFVKYSVTKRTLFSVSMI
jgi:hypothetical protein